MLKKPRDSRNVDPLSVQLNYPIEPVWVEKNREMVSRKINFCENSIFLGQVLRFVGDKKLEF
jgi:hypothetical protein